MTIIILGSMCGIGLVLMVAVGVSLLLLARAGNRDAVGSAREDLDYSPQRQRPAGVVAACGLW